MRTAYVVAAVLAVTLLAIFVLQNRYEYVQDQQQLPGLVFRIDKLTGEVQRRPLLDPNHRGWMRESSP
jgi:hypothetical protein